MDFCKKFMNQIYPPAFKYINIGTCDVDHDVGNGKTYGD